MLLSLFVAACSMCRLKNVCVSIVLKNLRYHRICRVENVVIYTFAYKFDMNFCMFSFGLLIAS